MYRHSSMRLSIAEIARVGGRPLLPRWMYAGAKKQDWTASSIHDWKIVCDVGRADYDFRHFPVAVFGHAIHREFNTGMWHEVHRRGELELNFVPNVQIFRDVECIFSLIMHHTATAARLACYARGRNREDACRQVDRSADHSASEQLPSWAL